MRACRKSCNMITRDPRSCRCCPMLIFIFFACINRAHDVHVACSCCVSLSGCHAKRRRICLCWLCALYLANIKRDLTAARGHTGMDLVVAPTGRSHSCGLICRYISNRCSKRNVSGFKAAERTTVLVSGGQRLARDS